MEPRLGVPGESESMNEQSAPEPTERHVVRKRGGREPLRDLVIPLAGIVAVVVGIVLVQLIRERESTPSAGRTFAPGSYSPIELGPSGGGRPKLGEPAPGFTLLDPDGRLIRLDDFRGRPVLVNFWGSWCVPCRKETPDLIQLQSEWGDQAQILGVNYSETADIARAFATNFGINYILPLDKTGEVTGSYKLAGFPETFFLDREGIIRDHRIGQLRPDVARCIVASIEAGDHKPEACR